MNRIESGSFFDRVRGGFPSLRSIAIVAEASKAQAVLQTFLPSAFSKDYVNNLSLEGAVNQGVIKRGRIVRCDHHDGTNKAAVYVGESGSWGHRFTAFYRKSGRLYRHDFCVREDARNWKETKGYVPKDVLEKLTRETYDPSTADDNDGY